MDPFLDSLFSAFAVGRNGSEGLGDWVSRVGLEAVREKQQQVREQKEAVCRISNSRMKNSN